jgi:hypothetical protein
MNSEKAEFAVHVPMTPEVLGGELDTDSCRHCYLAEQLLRCL